MGHTQKVCVTGANGFLGSHIVARCLDKGYDVRGTVRNALNTRTTQHLRDLDGASERLELVSAELLRENSYGFREAFADCDAVIHTASPGTRNSISDDDVHAAVFGTLAVLRACNAARVSVVVMTSGICAASPKPEPLIRRETDWSDPKEQTQSNNKYGASKTLAEIAAWKYMEQEKPSFRLVTMLPSCIVGPSLSCDLCITNICLLSLLKHGGPLGDTLPDDCFSFVDVRDCAAYHMAAMELPGVNGRYFCTAPSLHWNDLYEILGKINPRLAWKNPCSGKIVHGTFDLAKQESLGVDTMPVFKILSEAASYFKVIGVQAATTFVEDSWESERSTCSPRSLRDSECSTNCGSSNRGTSVTSTRGGSIMMTKQSSITMIKHSSLPQYSSYNEFGLPSRTDAGMAFLRRAARKRTASMDLETFHCAISD
jgi:dihydroflavonol-4-reductase